MNDIIIIIMCNNNNLHFVVYPYSYPRMGFVIIYIDPTFANVLSTVAQHTSTDHLALRGNFRRCGAR